MQFIEEFVTNVLKICILIYIVTFCISLLQDKFAPERIRDFVKGKIRGWVIWRLLAWVCLPRFVLVLPFPFLSDFWQPEYLLEFPWLFNQFALDK